MGAISRTKALTMAFKLLEMGEQRWRRLDSPHLLPLVRAGVKFVPTQFRRNCYNTKARREAAWSCAFVPQHLTMCDTKVVCVTVMTSDEGHHPLFCQRYPTRTCVAGNGEVRSSWDNVASSARRMAARARADAAVANTKAVGS